MRLRLRLAVTTIAVTVPMIGALLWLDAGARQDAAEARLAEAALLHMSRPGERQRCEAAPASWGGTPLGPSGPSGPREADPPPHGQPPPPGHRPRFGNHDRPGGAPPILFAYDDQLTSANPRAPAIPARLAEQIARSDVAMWSSAWRGSQVQVLVRAPWRSGPCALVLAHGTTVPGWLGAILPASRIWLAPTLLVIAAVLLAVGPVIRRLRQLTDAVRRSAAAGFDGSVAVGGSDEIGELGHAFEAAGQEIRAQLRAKDRREQALRDFLANTTHDIAIPLTVLQSHLATLQDRARAGEPFDMATLISAMDEAHYMASLMHNLTIAARLQASEPQMQRGPVDLNGLVHRVVGRHAPIARQLEVSLDAALPEPPISTDADVTLLEQAVSNVVYNAIRHNRAGGHVAVLLDTIGADHFRLRVIDDGPGIADDELSRLVERGFRGGEARNRSPEGQGLGLHITFEVARLHGLRLELSRSEYGGLQVDIAGLRYAGTA